MSRKRLIMKKGLIIVRQSPETHKMLSSNIMKEQITTIMIIENIEMNTDIITKISMLNLIIMVTVEMVLWHYSLLERYSLLYLFRFFGTMKSISTNLRDFTAMQRECARQLKIRHNHSLIKLVSQCTCQEFCTLHSHLKIRILEFKFQIA